MKGDRKLPHFDAKVRDRKRRRNKTVQGKADWDKHTKWKMRRGTNER